MAKTAAIWIAARTAILFTETSPIYRGDVMSQFEPEGRSRTVVS